MKMNRKLVRSFTFINCSLIPCEFYLFYFYVIFREPKSVQICTRKRLGLQEIHQKRFFVGRSQWVIARWQTYNILWGIYEFKSYCPVEGSESKVALSKFHNRRQCSSLPDLGNRLGQNFHSVWGSKLRSRK